MAMAASLLSTVTRISETAESWIRSSFDGSSPPSSSVPPVQDQLGRLRRMLPRIQAVLDDAEKMEIQDESVKLWLREIKEVAYEADDVLDEYQYQLLRAEVEAAASLGSQTAQLPHGGELQQINCFRAQCVLLQPFLEYQRKGSLHLQDNISYSSDTIIQMIRS